MYACAFLESVSDIKALFAGGEVPLQKGNHQMSVDAVLTGTVYGKEGNSGLCYSQYLAGMILLLNEEIQNLRAMDIMEMDIRFRRGSTGFCMDWCIERYEAFVTAGGSMPMPIQLRRQYGYF